MPRRAAFVQYSMSIFAEKEPWQRAMNTMVRVGYNDAGFSPTTSSWSILQDLHGKSPYDTTAPILTEDASVVWPYELKLVESFVFDIRISIPAAPSLPVSHHCCTQFQPSASSRETGLTNF